MDVSCAGRGCTRAQSVGKESVPKLRQFWRGYPRRMNLYDGKTWGLKTDCARQESQKMPLLRANSFHLLLTLG
jgi:hypothetical protein